MAGTGGKRQGSGRKKREIKELQRSFAAEILSDTVEKNRFRQLLDSEDERIRFDTLKLLTEYKRGKPKQVLAGDPENPIEHMVTLEIDL